MIIFIQYDFNVEFNFDENDNALSFIKKIFSFLYIILNEKSDENDLKNKKLLYFYINKINYANENET